MNSPSQISFLDGTFSLIHIPLSLYPNFLQPILQVLLPNGAEADYGEGAEGLSVDHKHGFLNISITPVECSVVCHTVWADRVFAPVVARLPADASRTVTVSRDSYLILSVISAGMDAGNRVMELTSPLALAGIPIFFITTYYSDFILVPAKDRQTVVQALLSRGFEFSEDEAAFVSPQAHAHSRGPSAGSSSSGSSSVGSANGQPPSTPPPSNAAELQTRTFELLRKRRVVPYLEPDLSVVLCSGRDLETEQMADFGRRAPLSRRPTGNGHACRSWLDHVDTKLYTSLISVLALQPRFLSMTLAQEDPPSLLLDKAHLGVFGDSLVGDTEGDLVPIFLDLENLPLEATGIVSGVAGRLVAEMRMVETGVTEQLSYLSTARAGAVILSAGSIADTARALQETR